ncbi:MAG: hypothetical protein WAN71_11655 [Mycobacterium sp.]|uniref:hypothetical protein n=1 Tax=Mycobacterium sp. TaxID=1785 RepID=UPI003BB0527A
MGSRPRVAVAAGNRSAKAVGNYREAAVGGYRGAAVDNFPTVAQAVAQSSAHSFAELNLLGKQCCVRYPSNAAKEGY